MKRLVLYPFLFVLDVILTPLALNLDQLDPSQVIRPLWVLLLAVSVGWALIYLLVRDWQYAGYLVFLLILYLCTFGYLSRSVDELLSDFGKSLIQPVFLAICAVGLGILAYRGVWEGLGGRRGLAAYLNWMVLLGLLFPAFGVVSHFVVDPLRAGTVSASPRIRAGDTRLVCGNRPDIYYIILDGYGRADVLEELYGLDTQSFVAYLESKGFYVAAESHTNYIQTIYSVPSGLNFNFIAPPEESMNSQAYFDNLMRRNGIMTALKRCGYRTVAFKSGFYFSNHPKVDVYFEQGMGMNEFESLLLADSPVEVLARELGFTISEHSYAAHRQRVLYTFDKLAMLPRMAGPKLVFAHIVSPHPPFVFDASGQLLDPDYLYYIGDGDDYQGEAEEYISGYTAQVQFINQKVEQLVEAILSNSATPPIIIFQGDHGPGSRLVWDSPSQTCLWERTPILNAYYLPGEGATWLYPSISPVNTFRVVLNAYFGADLALLPDDTYFSSHQLERQVIDITAERDSRENCAVP